jgi:hypothetical protein
LGAGSGLFVLSVTTAIWGPLVETFLSGIGAFHYVEPNLYLVTSWLPVLYAIAAVGNGHLGKALVEAESRRRPVVAMVSLLMGLCLLIGTPALANAAEGFADSAPRPPCRPSLRRCRNWQGSPGEASLQRFASYLPAFGANPEIK